MDSYTQMQKNIYESDATSWSINNRNPVVGSFDAHNAWADYETYLFKDIKTSLHTITALDFGCGPGRNLVKFADKLKRLDGVDISQNNLDNAKLWIAHNKLDTDNFTLYLCNGKDLDNIDSKKYDLIISTITLQHICVHEIRLNYFKEFYRVLKPGGMISLQMGYGLGTHATRDYYDDYYDASATNGQCDTRVDDPRQLKDDLTSIGFVDFKYYIRPTGPGDRHGHWIFFNARK